MDLTVRASLCLFCFYNHRRRWYVFSSASSSLPTNVLGSCFPFSLQLVSMSYLWILHFYFVVMLCESWTIWLFLRSDIFLLCCCSHLLQPFFNVVLLLIEVLSSNMFSGFCAFVTIRLECAMVGKNSCLIISTFYK